MKSQTRFVFNAVHILIWIVFIGLCIKTGTLIFNLILNLFFETGISSITIDPRRLTEIEVDMQLNPQSLLEFGKGHYYARALLILLFLIIQTYIAYLAVKIFRKLRLEKPFCGSVTWLIKQMSYVALGAGVLAIAAEGYTEWIILQGVKLTNNWNGGSFLLLAGLIFILAEVFRRGTELQNENELTV